MTLLRAEKFLGSDFIDAEDHLAFENVDLITDEFHDIELEKERFQNIRKHAAMLMHIIDDTSKIWYPPTVRTKFEVRNGYKHAVKRGARLEETDVFNLLFSFKGHLPGDGVAMMCHGPLGQEWIMLCPDDTNKRIELEKQKYLTAALDLTFKQRMDSDEQSRLIENLRCLNLGTRCSNSLQHEFGHVLQYRIWFEEGIETRDDESLYKWFLSIGYVDNVAMRIPGFMEDPIYYLKEAFVEDYRIGLNLTETEGKFELPNAYCFRGDFVEPKLMYEGVDIVKTVIEKHKVGSNSSKVQASFEREPDRLALVDKFMASGEEFDPMKSRMTPADHQAVLDRFRSEKLRLV